MKGIKAYGLLATLLLAGLFPALPSSTSYSQSDCRTYPETNKTLCGKFRSYWDSNGGLAQQGFPISNEMQEKSDIDGKTYTVQYFERAVFELHPENQPPNDVLLSLLGVIFYRQRWPLGGLDTPNTTAGSVMFPETGKRLGGIFLDYWNKHGSLPQQGYPISNEFTERSFTDGQPYTVQYFERAVFENHNGTVLLSLLGVSQYDRKYNQGKLPAPVPQPAPNAQGVVNVTVKHLGIDRPLIIVIPPNYIKGQPVPLVLVLHGGNGNGQDFYDSTPDIPEASKRFGFIAVYLTGLPEVGAKDTDDAFWNDAINEAYVPYVMDYMQVNYSIDTKRIYMVGFSGGAQEIYKMAADPYVSKRIAAIGTAAGDIGSERTPSSPMLVIDPLKLGGMPMSALLVQGVKDTHLPINGGPNDVGEIKLDFQGKVDLWVKFIAGTSAPAPNLAQVPQRAQVARYVNSQTGYTVVTIIDPVLAHKWPDWPLMASLWQFFQSVPTR